VSNLFRVNSPAALEAYVNFRSAPLGSGTFDATVQELIDLTVAESNLCSYCFAALISFFPVQPGSYRRNTSRATTL
jgi:alkylhydroperoxidase family enzyme